MNPMLNPTMYVSKLTSALFEDSGWYLTNDLHSDLIHGDKMGCSYPE